MGPLIPRPMYYALQYVLRAGRAISQCMFIEQSFTFEDYIEISLSSQNYSSLICKVGIMAVGVPRG